MGIQATPPLYEVEFIPLERRMAQRRSPMQQMNASSEFGERRSSPGRRKEDWEAYYAAKALNS